MGDLKLIPPSADYLQSYLEGCREFKLNHISEAMPHDPDLFETWRNTIFTDTSNSAKGIGLPAGWVPSSTFWLVNDTEFLGLGNIRHYLSDSLRKFGGNIGYAVRPSEWNKGFGTILLKKLLVEANHLNINPALITCNDWNIGSIRVIEKNGGVLQDCIVYEKRLERRYLCKTDTNNSPTI